jgi:hypothetical protein
MTVVGGERRARPKPKVDEVEQLRRLIAIQTQIVELAKENELTEQQCAELRHELSQSRRRSAPQWSPLRWLRAVAQRFKRRAS